MARNLENEPSDCTLKILQAMPSLRDATRMPTHCGVLAITFFKRATNYANNGFSAILVVIDLPILWKYSFVTPIATGCLAITNTV
ncbi:hypothetical protein [Nostoc sp. NZL]|uniref:hypothetical protein n=1 Tax=Nostoc sp. NZL TaxID=2650612 RepID=UPI0018C4660C|nr:hypothetical protein [Nostoc sp. NZL]